MDRIADVLTGGPRFASFCEHFIRQTKGSRWAGRPLLLEAWQRDFWWEALEVDPATGLRIYQEVGLGIPRKNGKSVQASAAGLYFLVADGEAEPEVIAAAAAKNQAGIVLGQSRRMATQSPTLRPLLHIQKHLIECPRNGGTMRSVSSDAGVAHGSGPSASIVDELHAHKSPDLYTALTTGTGARDQPFTLWISTSGSDSAGILASIHGSMFTGSGVLEQRSEYLVVYRDRVNGVLIYWYGAPRDADVEDPRVWRGCNPASWLQEGDALRREFGRMRDRGALLEWRLYHLNQFAGSEDAWIASDVWARAGTVGELRKDLPIGIGVHKAHAGDAAAIVWAQRQPEHLVIRHEMFVAESATGHVSTEAMRRRLRQLAQEFPLAQMRDPTTGWPIRGPAVAFDKMGFIESAEALDADGVNMVDFPQGAGHMGPATAVAYEAILTGRLQHDADVRMAAHVEATVARLTDRGMVVVPNRKQGSRPNHGAVAMVMAIAMATQEAPPPRARRPTAVGF